MSQFNTNPELVAMKEEIAERGLRIKLTGLAITAAFFAGALFLPGLAPITTILMMAGGGIASILTYKATKKLQIDQEYLESRMQGKNWWTGYREEVAQQGYGQSATPVLPGIPSEPQRGK